MSNGHTQVGCSPRPGSTIATALRRLHHASAHVIATAAFFAAAEQQSPTGGDGDGKKVATTAAAGYSLVRLAAADLHECALLSSQAYRHFWDDGTLDGEAVAAMVRSQEERLRRKLSHTRAWGLRWSGGDDSLVGCVFMYSSHDPVSGGAGHARVSGMVTSPDHRRRGLAKVLMEALMEEAGQMPLSLNATTMGKPLYDSLGFRDLDGYVEWSSSTAAAKHRPTAAQVEQLAQQAGATLTVVRAPKAADAELVRRLDTAVFGGDRGGLLQDTFTDGGVGGVLVVARRRAAVMMDEGPEPDVVIGYCHSAAHPRWGRFIAPVVARSPEAALALVGAQAALAELRGERLRLLVRHAQQQFTAGLAALGFAEDEEQEGSYPSPGMVRCANGSHSFPGQREHYFALLDRGSG